MLLPLAAALVSLSSLATEPRWLAKEITPEMMADGPSFHSSWKRLSAHRFFLLGAIRERNPDGTPAPARYRLLDLTTLSVVEISIPFKDFPREHLETLSIKELQGAELVHHDGGVTTMLVDQMAGWKRVGVFLVQYDHRSGRFSRLVRVGGVVPNHFLHHLGFDALDEHYYFADVTTDDRDPRRRPIAYDLSRVDLRTLELDWRVSIDLPRRARPLSFDAVRFSPDGRWLAVAEYDDRAGVRDGPTKPPPQVYVIDLASRRIDPYAIPLSAYGVAFTPDSRFLLVGSHEQGTVLRIDVVARRQTHSVQATKTIHEFHAPAGADYFLVVNNYELSPRKVVDVRSTADLRLLTSIPIDELFPGCGKGSPGFLETMDGRFLFAGNCRTSRPGGPSGLWIYEPPPSITPPAPGSVEAARLLRGETLALGKAYGKGTGVELSDFPMGAFASAAVSTRGNAFIAGVRGASAVVAKVAPSGKRLWERVLPDKKFKEQAGGVLSPTPDDGCVAYFLSYVHPGADPSARLVRLDANGKVLWDLNFAGSGAPNMPYANDGLELRPDGAVVLKGIVQVSPDLRRPWTGVVSADGKLLSSEPPVAPP